MKFTKMHGCGNDYIYFDCTKEPLANPAKLAVCLSDRHFGVGGDGIILIKPSEKADFYMEMYNADGSQGKMCGNGIRCVAKYVYDAGLTDKTCITVDTLSGVKTLELFVENGKVKQVTVAMGRPSFAPADIPALAEEALLQSPVTLCGKTYEMTALSVGNPHVVIRVEDVASFPVEQVGPVLEHHPMFPEQVNAEFVQVLDRTRVCMRVWERGSGETWACGTGACATAVACYKNGWTDSEVTVVLRGGELKIRYDEKEDAIFMTGPAETVFTGEIEETVR